MICQGIMAVLPFTGAAGTQTGTKPASRFDEAKQRAGIQKDRKVLMLADALAALTGNRVRDNLTRFKRKAMAVVP